VKPKASDSQIIDALKKHRGIRAHAARELGLGTRAVHARIDAMRNRGVEIPESTYDGRVAGTSTLYGADGEVKLTWVKEKAGEPGPEQWAEIVKDVFCATDRVKSIPAPSHGRKDLLVVIPIGDHHVAMYSWPEETGQAYDVKEAERLLIAAALHLVEVCPPAETCLIANVGDFFHYDSQRAETPLNKNALDVDTRYAGMIRAGVAMMRTFIEAALAKYRKVRVVNAPGNHDPIGALWLSLSLALLYEKNARVSIETSPSKFSYHHHGKVLVGITHGDTAKLDRLAGVMAVDRPELWGKTQHRYWLTGHIHQRKVIEQPGVMVESFRTLAARDAWASAGGYRSGRDMTALVFHAEHGEVARHRFDVGMLE
jgi:hypothetical protein